MIVQGVKDDGVIDHRQMHLVPKLQAMQRELVNEAHMVRALQQTGAERRMHLHCGTDDSMRDVFMQHQDAISVFAEVTVVPSSAGQIMSS
jgi:hypothetical protein